MTNLEAAEILRSRIKQDDRMQFLAVAVRQAYEKAIQALEHQPEPQDMGIPIGEQCEDCRAGAIFSAPHPIRTTCPCCGSTNMRPTF